MTEKTNFPKNYLPADHEDRIYQKWEKSGFFNPDNLDSKERYANILPPPNANGELHIGHTSGYIAMDLFGRFQRMLGKKTLLLPGKDHAGIQTQVVFEKKIKAERGLSRHDLGREKFYSECYDFCIDRSGYMRNQEKKLGLSADWSREKFTLDPKIIKTVLQTFVDMWNEVDEQGRRMVYRGERIINWCPRCASALSDMEVEHEDKKARLYTFKYSADFPFAISTTRPETKLGDTAVAVNPKDKRYQKYLGQTFQVDFLGVKLSLKVIADEEVDPEFGTGALGVTPAHSIVDWEMAQKNDLKIIKVIDEEAKIRPGFREFSGQSAEKARQLIVEKLRENELLLDEQESDQALSVCERCKTTIEPLISKQWFVDVDHANFSLKKEARKVIESDEIKIYPARFKKILLAWIDNVHDWCISRQIWWGPRIPAWYRETGGENRDAGRDEIFVGLEPPRPENQTTRKPDDQNWQQDEDTFDTWFSSGQWAFTTLGFDQGQDFKDFYPSDTMIMGRDILPFWAFRMIILSLFKTRQIPFKNLYFTGLVRDEHGQKMSKSRGNGIDPLEMIEKYGTDAIRLSLVIGSAPGNDLNLGEAKIQGQRNFITKLWNIGRYVKKINEDPSSEDSSDGATEIEDRWLINKMSRLRDEVTENLENYQFSQAAEKLRDFTWNEFAGWYLETVKMKKRRGYLAYNFGVLLRLWHPFIPFVTEALWESFYSKEAPYYDEKIDGLLMIQEWPKNDETKNQRERHAPSEKYFDLIKKIITTIRAARSENKIDPARKIKAVIYAKDKKELIESQAELIKNLRTGIETLEIKESGQKIPGEIFVAIGPIEIYLIGAIDREKERGRLQKEIENLESFISGIEKKLSNPDFLKKAPAQIIQKEKEKLSAKKEELGKMKKQLN